MKRRANERENMKHQNKERKRVNFSTTKKESETELKMKTPDIEIFFWSLYWIFNKDYIVTFQCSSTKLKFHTYKEKMFDVQESNVHTHSA